MEYQKWCRLRWWTRIGYLFIFYFDKIRYNNPDKIYTQRLTTAKSCFNMKARWLKTIEKSQDTPDCVIRSEIKFILSTIREIGKFTFMLSLTRKGV